MLITPRHALIVAALAFLPFQVASAQGGLNVTGIHSREPICQTMIKQYDLMTTFTKSAIGLGDPAAKKKYFADQKALNATLVRQAPPSLSTDIALLARDANFSYDAQLGTDRKAIMAGLAPMRRPEHLAAAKRAKDYCGLSVTK